MSPSLTAEEAVQHLTPLQGRMLQAVAHLGTAPDLPVMVKQLVAGLGKNLARNPMPDESIVETLTVAQALIDIILNGDADQLQEGMQALEEADAVNVEPAGELVPFPVFEPAQEIDETRGSNVGATGGGSA